MIFEYASTLTDSAPTPRLTAARRAIAWTFFQVTSPGPSTLMIDVTVSHVIPQPISVCRMGSRPVRVVWDSRLWS